MPPLLPPLILASNSPRRIDILKSLGVPFHSQPSHFDEESLPYEENPSEYVCLLAHSKARHVAADHPHALVIGADTLVFLDGKPLGKPSDAQHAAEYLSRLSGRWHHIYTGLSIINGKHSYEAAEEARVLFNPLTARQIATYVATDGWRDKSGGYSLLTWGALLIAKVEGCCHNVTGLPVNTLQTLFLRSGYDLWDYVGRA